MPMESNVSFTYSIDKSVSWPFDLLSYHMFEYDCHLTTLLSFDSPGALLVVRDRAFVITTMIYPTWGFYDDETLDIDRSRRYWIGRISLRWFLLILPGSMTNFGSGFDEVHQGVNLVEVDLVWPCESKSRSEGVHWPTFLSAWGRFFQLTKMSLN